MRGDGIGPEIVEATLSVLSAALEPHGVRLAYTEVQAGDETLRLTGSALPDESVRAFAESDACLKGPVGDTVMEINTKLRFGFDLYANLRPARSYPGICPPALKPDIDMVVIRENSEGFYRAIENEIVPGVWTSAGVFTRAAAERIADFTFRYAHERPHDAAGPRHVTLATKANIFQRTHGMYLEVFRSVHERHPDIQFEHLYADALCARLVRDPERFDVIVSENLLADLLSDLAGQVAGGLGMTPGTNINYETRRAYFEPTHGSAPDIAGRGVANPIGQIRSGALMLEYLGMVHGDVDLGVASREVEGAIRALLNSSKAALLPMELGGRAGSRAVAETLVGYLGSDAPR